MKTSRQLLDNRHYEGKTANKKKSILQSISTIFDNLWLKLVYIFVTVAL